MPYAEVNGQRLYYTDSGSGDPIIFSHGFLMDHTMFDAQVAALSGNWRCIRWDERGHGRTETSSAAFTYWDSAADLFGLLDHLGIESAVLAGMSQGGFLSLRAALTAPERVRALVLMDSQPGVEHPEKVAAYNQLLDGWIAVGMTDQLADIVAAIIIGPGFADTPAWQQKWRDLDTTTVRQTYTTLVNRENDVTPRLAEITAPTLVVHGSNDASIELSIAQQYAAELPNAELVVVEGGGHASNMTHADQVNPALEQFLSSLSR